MGFVYLKPGVKFDTDSYGRETSLKPGGIRILAAVDQAAQKLGYGITITAGCDGLHSGPEDPHPLGNALDIRTHQIPDKQSLLMEIQKYLGDEHFYAFIEDPGTDNEHIHAQVKKNTIFPPEVVAVKS